MTVKKSLEKSGKIQLNRKKGTKYKNQKVVSREI